jgi:hypothetical protein
MTCQTTLPWCKGEDRETAITRRIDCEDRCCPRSGPTWCEGSSMAWTPIRVADLTWGRMHL